MWQHSVSLSHLGTTGSHLFHFSAAVFLLFIAHTPLLIKKRKPSELHGLISPKKPLCTSNTTNCAPPAGHSAEQLEGRVGRAVRGCPGILQEEDGPLPERDDPAQGIDAHHSVPGLWQEAGKEEFCTPPSHLTPGQNGCACGMTNKEKLPLSWFSRSQRKRSRTTSSSRRTWRRGSTGSKTYAGPSHASRVGRSSPGSPPDAPSASRIKST